MHGLKEILPQTVRGAHRESVENRVLRESSFWTVDCTTISGERSHGPPERSRNMLWTIFVILLILWLLGVVTSYTLGGFIHILLVIAIAVVLINLIQGRRAV